MIDRDKVIKGLEEVVNDFHEEVDEWSAYTNDELRGGTTVDCDWFYGVMEKCEAALALLNAQLQSQGNKHLRKCRIDGTIPAKEMNWND